MDEFEKLLDDKINEAKECLAQARLFSFLEQVEVAWQLHLEELQELRQRYRILRLKNDPSFF